MKNLIFNPFFRFWYISPKQIIIYAFVFFANWACLNCLFAEGLQVGHGLDWLLKRALEWAAGPRAWSMRMGQADWIGPAGRDAEAAWAYGLHLDVGCLSRGGAGTEQGSAQLLGTWACWRMG